VSCSATKSISWRTPEAVSRAAPSRISRAAEIFHPFKRTMQCSRKRRSSPDRGFRPAGCVARISRRTDKLPEGTAPSAGPRVSRSGLAFPLLKKPKFAQSPVFLRMMPTLGLLNNQLHSMRKRIGAELELDDQRARQSCLGLAGGAGRGASMPSICCGVRLPDLAHKARPFQPTFGSSIRPSSPLVKNPIG
jgi:hypothetical protein